MTQNISSTKTLVQGFQLLNKKLETERWKKDLLSFTALFSGWRTLNKMLKHLERLTAPDYNVFYVMKNMAASEVKLHSPFLADLLNVHGEHKQGDLFYRELVRMLKLPASIYLPNDTQWFEVRTEVASGTGGIDLLISYENGLQKFAIAIENKIYAGDQKRQLERYHEYLTERFGQAFTLLYLTPRGHNPSAFSASPDFLLRNQIRCISYQHHIVELLSKTISFVTPVSVRSVLEQYLVVCQSL